MHLQLAAEPTAAELVLTSFPSMNPMSAARLISLGCSLSELLTLQAEEQEKLAAKLSDIPTNSLDLFFQQATWGQAITGQPMTAPEPGQQQNALECTQQHAGRQHGRQQAAFDQTALYSRLADYAHLDVDKEACNARAGRPAGLQSRPYDSTPTQHTMDMHPMQHSRNALQVARTSNPFGAFQYQPEHQSTGRALGSEKLHGSALQGHSHDYAKQRGALSGIGPPRNFDCLQIEEVPCDYTEDYSTDALESMARLADQHQPQQQQQGIDWQNYLPEEEEGIAGNSLMGEQMPWQASRHHHRFADDPATAAEMLPMDGMDIEEDGVPDVVIDDALEPETTTGALQTP